MISRLLSSFLVLAASSAPVMAQGPTLSYLADPGTRLDWAECQIYTDGGSRHRIPFLPVVTFKRSPAGTDRYSKDVSIRAPIVFAGNGVVEGRLNRYQGLDLNGKAVLFSYDSPGPLEDALEKDAPLEERVREAVARGAVGVVLFSWKEDVPFPVFRERDIDRIPEVPVIAINQRSAAMILESGGRDSAKVFENWKSKGEFQAEVLISKLDLRMEGKFDRIETDNFAFCFQPGRIPSEQREALAAVNEKSVLFLLDLFREGRVRWTKKLFTAYFADYDSKLFYVHHWGRGLSGEQGVFVVWDGAPDFPLAVHENTHSLLDRNWGRSSSFMTEGMGKYAEAMASDREANHKQVVQYLRESRLIPLSRLRGVDIGAAAETAFAYPAAGSFVQHLVETHSLQKVRAIYEREGTPREGGQTDAWREVFGKSLAELEREWLLSLADSYRLERRRVEAFLARSSG